MFLNTRNELYRERGMSKNAPPRKEAVRLMSEHPNLIKRPILVKGNKIVLLDSDVASVFPDSTTVNQALRLLIQLAEGKAVAGAKQRSPNKALQPGAQKRRR